MKILKNWTFQTSQSYSQTSLILSPSIVLNFQLPLRFSQTFPLFFKAQQKCDANNSKISPNSKQRKYFIQLCFECRFLFLREKWKLQNPIILRRTNNEKRRRRKLRTRKFLRLRWCTTKGIITEERHNSARSYAFMPSSFLRVKRI